MNARHIILITGIVGEPTCLETAVGLSARLLLCFTIGTVQLAEIQLGPVDLIRTGRHVGLHTNASRRISIILIYISDRRLGLNIELHVARQGSLAQF